jgi:hypothetical protein
MSFVEIAGAFGLGAIAVKLLDILWLRRVLSQSEKARWLREQRLRVYSGLASELLSMGRAHGTREDVFRAYSFVAEALLLVEDDGLAARLDQFFTHLSNLYKKGTMEKPDVPEEELEAAYAFVFSQSRSLVVELRKSLRRS